MYHSLEAKRWYSCVATTSAAGTERPVETTDTVHVLAVLGLLLLPHGADVVADHLLSLGGAKTPEAHHRGHIVVHAAVLDIEVLFVLVHRFSTFIVIVSPATPFAIIVVSLFLLAPWATAITLAFLT